MNNDKLQPMTEEEKAMAEKYHNIIYTFLHKRGYSIEDYYDIAVMGYLKAVQKYCRDDNLKLKWSFKAICENDIRREIGNATKRENTKKRMPEGGFTSLDAKFEDSNESFINSIVTPTLEDEFFAKYDKLDEADRIKNVLSKLTDIQRKIVLLKADGHTHSEISNILNITFGTVGKELRKIRNGIEEPKEKTETNIEKYIGVTQAVLSSIKLSSRQMEVIELLLLGLTEMEVGKRLGLSRQAVYDSVKKVRLKANKLQQERL